jgi:hypothetical protein
MTKHRKDLQDYCDCFKKEWVLISNERTLIRRAALVERCRNHHLPVVAASEAVSHPSREIASVAKNAPSQ